MTSPRTTSEMTVNNPDPAAESLALIEMAATTLLEAD
jgi:hypothetical protein